MRVKLGRVTLYATDVDRTVAFYEKYFGYLVLRLPEDRIIELVCSNGGANIMVHQAAKSQKHGQVLVKLGFDVEDVVGFAQHAATQGLEFGPLHKADGYVFANAKDPSGNSISITGRAYRKLK